MNQVITIGREFGSGGKELARKLADEMGFAYYDDEIVNEIVKRTNFSEDYIHMIVEKRPVLYHPFHAGVRFFSHADPHVERSQQIASAQYAIIHEMAEKSPCVVVGRCADYILRENTPYRIFVCSDMESKMRRYRADEDPNDRISDKELFRQIRRVNKDRAQYYHLYTGLRWGDRENYELCINTSHMDIDAAVPHIAELARTFFATATGQESGEEA
ncbi:MAG: cytidylate kinase-like family protein [Ruminococcaceae bacterium]|nr:cytidylate kinase-like family protein [Oscillospiraceae bacterium]